MYPFIELFGKQIPIYGICYYLGIALSAIVAVSICKKRNIERYDIVYSAVYAVLAGALCAKLLFIGVSLRQIIELKLSFIQILKGGFVFYGGLIGGAAGLAIYVKQFKLPAADFFDIYAAAMPLGHAVGRVGCLFAGCCYGMEYDGPLSVTYNYSVGNTPIGVPLLPIQIIEAVLLFVLFIALMVLFFNTKVKYLVTATYILSYAGIRFVIEFFRGDLERGKLAGFATSQWISLALIMVTVALMCLSAHRRNKAHESTPVNEFDS